MNGNYRLEAHDTKAHRDRRDVEVAICGFLAARKGVSVRSISVDDVRRFVARSPLYPPLLNALDAVDHFHRMERL